MIFTTEYIFLERMKMRAEKDGFFDEILKRGKNQKRVKLTMA